MLLTVGVFLFCGLSSAQNRVQSDYYCKDIKKPFFSSAAEGVFRAQRREALPEEFSMPKPAGVKRVFIVGESAGITLGQGKSIVPQGRSSGLEIINCSMGGYDSYRIYGVLREVLDYSPDLVVVISGNNEGRSEPCPGFEPELRRRKYRLLERFYSFKYGLRDAENKASLKTHENMLVKMARAAKKAGVPIVFCTLPSIVKDLSLQGHVPLNEELFASGYGLFYNKKYQAALDKFRLGLASKPDDYFLNFYIAKTLEKLGRTREAKAGFLKALDFDGSIGRSGGRRNELIRRVAASEGACVADLKKFFYSVSPGGLPGFSEFTDIVHWTKPYNKPVCAEILRSAGACAIKGFEKFTAESSGRGYESPREDALKRLSYAFSWIGEKDLNDQALAELSHIQEKVPGLLEEAAVSPERLEKLLIHNFWMAGALGDDLRCEGRFPFVLVHLSESKRRIGDYAAALSLCERARSLKPDNNHIRLERARILADMGRKKEAGSEFLALAADCDLYVKTKAFGRVYGFAMPTAPEKCAFKKEAEESKKLSDLAVKEMYSDAFRKEAEKSKKLSDLAVKKTLSGDFKGAKRLLFKALGKNPSNPEALMSLCALLQKEGEKEKALNACQEASKAVYANADYRTPGFEILAAEASFESYKLLYALRRKPEAVEVLRDCIKKAPAAWLGLAEAREALIKTGVK